MTTVPTRSNTARTAKNRRGDSLDDVLAEATEVLRDLARRVDALEAAAEEEAAK